LPVSVLLADQSGCVQHRAYLARAVDTTGIVPMSHAQDVILPLREDRVSESDPHQRDLYQRNAPAVEDGLYLVPKVIE